jgi:hypothetical protein
MIEPAKPSVSWGTRVDTETDQLRRQLQQATGWSASRLISEALQVLAPRIINSKAAALDANRERAA